MLRGCIKRLVEWLTQRFAPALKDPVTGEVLGRAWVFVWRGKIRVVGLRRWVRVGWAPRNEVRYGWHDLEFKSVEAKGFPAEGTRPLASLKSSADRRKMDVLWVVLTHQKASHFERLRQVWESVHGSVLWVWGGEKGGGLFLPEDRRVMVDDPRLRTRQHPVERQSYQSVWRGVSEWMAGADWERVGFFEEDHLPLVEDLATRWENARVSAEGDVMFHGLRQADGTQSSHLLTHRVEAGFEAFWNGVSVRQDQAVVWDALATGSFWRREAWDAVAGLEVPVRIYLEMFLPTAAHHLGWRVRAFEPAESRWVGVEPWQGAAVQAARHEGVGSIHPVKPAECERLDLSGWMRNHG